MLCLSARAACDNGRGRGRLAHNVNVNVGDIVQAPFSNLCLPLPWYQAEAAGCDLDELDPSRLTLEEMEARRALARPTQRRRPSPRGGQRRSPARASRSIV